MAQRFAGTALVLLIGGLIAAPAAQAEQLFSVNVGYFMVRGEDARIQDDVLVANLTLFPQLAYELSDFNNASLAGEWLVGAGDFFEGGFGLGFYRRTVPSIYRDLVHPDRSEIEQDLRLRIVPITATVRLFPLGRFAAVQPYVGGGIGMFNWRYTEVGEFVDAFDFTIFRDRFVAQGNDFGPVALGGVRFPLAPNFSLAGEIRYQRARGTLGPEAGFMDDRIDLGGVNSQVNLQFRF